MKKTIYIIAISVLTIAAIIYGTYYNTTKFVRNWTSCVDSEWFDDDDNSYHKSGVLSDSVIFSSSEQFTEIEINTNVMEVNIKEGTEYKLIYQCSKENLIPEWTVEDSKLIVKQHAGKNMTGNNTARLTITVPRFTELENIEIKTNVGEINLAGLDCKNVEIKTNVGEVDVQNIDFNSMEITTNVGEVAVNLPKPLTHYAMEIKSDIGEINVGNTEKHKSYSQKGESNGAKLTVKTNIGEITVD